MPYSQFTINQIKRDFGIRISEKVGIFADIPEIEYSKLLGEILEYNVPLALAIASEKARSEMIISPILIELRRLLSDRISLFSGRDFDVDATKGLNGFCDFIISQSPAQIIIEAPVIALVKAKNDNIQSGLAQCMAEMLAAQLFNDSQGNNIPSVYGAVTTGTNWKFMKLTNQVIEIDLNEYCLNQLGKILGILKHAIETNSSNQNKIYSNQLKFERYVMVN